MDYLEKLKKYLRTQIAYNLTEDPIHIDEIQKLSKWFLEHNKPKSFNPYDKNNSLISQEQEFENMATALEENGVIISGLTVFEFYSRCKYFEKKSKK